MRIADKMAFDQVKGNIGKNRSQMSELQNQAATQKRVTKPSDDPLAASRVLSSRIDLQGNKQFSKSLSYAKSFLEFSDQSLGELGDILVRAKELALSQASDGASNEQSRRVVATELNQLYNQMVAIGNRKLGDRFIFGGFNTQQTPFDDNGNYAGDGGEMMIHIDKETFLPMNVPGGRVFLGLGVSPDGMVKSGPAQPKTLEELHAQLAKQRGPELDPGQKDGMQIQTQPQAQLRGPAGERVDTPVAEDVQGGLNLFHLIKGLSIALEANDKAGVQDSLEALDAGAEQVVLTRSQVGSRSTVLDNFMSTIEKQKVDNKTTISALEDADVFSTVSDINKTESTLQATLETSGKMIQPSLLQFLR
jgi:flagellar hook-associated protein 3 FlgL